MVEMGKLPPIPVRIAALNAAADHIKAAIINLEEAYPSVSPYVVKNELEHELHLIREQVIFLEGLR